MRVDLSLCTRCCVVLISDSQFYSNGYSEVILGKAIKEFQLPREEIVVMTKAQI